MSAKQALEAGVSIADLLWVAAKLGHRDLCVRFALACARRVEHLSANPRVKACNDATQAWLDDPCERTRKAAANAAYDAANAANAPNAAYAARYAARYAADAADAAYAAYAAAYAAADAAAAARQRERDEQRRLFLEIFS